MTGRRQLPATLVARRWTGSVWEAEDAVRWLSMTGLAVVLWVIGWFLASGEASFGRQTGPANIAVGGVILFGAANVMWIMRVRRAVGRRIAEMSSRYDVFAEADSLGSVEPLIAGEDSGLVSLVDGSYFHTEGCRLLVGRPVDMTLRASNRVHVESGRQPCGICLR